MPIFTYRATNVSGVITEGTMEAREEQAVVSRLQGDGYIPIRITKDHPPQTVPMNISVSSLFKRISRRDVLTLTQELATLLEAGLPLDRSLRILSGLTPNPILRQVIDQLLADVQGGTSLTNALSKYPHIFSRLYVNLVHAGETGGVLNSVLRRIAEFLERAQDLRDYLSSAMAYPIVLLAASCASIVLLLAFVVPRFATIFSDATVDLPLPLQGLLAISRILGTYWWGVLGIGVTLIIGWRLYIGTPAGLLAWDRVKLSLPVFGTVLQKAEVAGFARTLGTLLHNGVPILEAMDIVKETVENRVFSRAIDEARQNLKRGVGVGDTLKQIHVFPSLATQMTIVGDETGRLDTMLITIADTYDQQVRTSIKRLTSLLEPIMILGMAVIVGGIVISMLVGIFSINELPL